jgi:hypothetical protein
METLADILRARAAVPVKAKKRWSRRNGCLPSEMGVTVVVAREVWEEPRSRRDLRLILADTMDGKLRKEEMYAVASRETAEACTEVHPPRRKDWPYEVECDGRLHYHVTRLWDVLQTDELLGG